MKNEESASSRKKIKINFVDIIMIVIAAAAIVAAVYFGITLLSDGLFFSGTNQNGSANVEYEIRLEMVDTSIYSFTKGIGNTVTSPFLKTGDTVYDRESGKAIGTVVSMSYKNSQAPTGRTDENGNLEYAEYPDHIDITLKVEAYADTKGGMFEVGGYKLHAGGAIEFRTYGYYGDGVIVSVVEKQVQTDETTESES